MKNARFLLVLLTASCGGTTPEAATVPLASPEAATVPLAAPEAATVPLAAPEVDLPRRLATAPAEASYVVVRAGAPLFLAAQGETKFGETVRVTRFTLVRGPEGGRVAVRTEPLAEDAHVPGCRAAVDPRPNRRVRLDLYVDAADLVPVVTAPFRLTDESGAEVRAAVGTPVRVESGRVRLVDEGIEVELLAGEPPHVAFAFGCADEACAEVVVPEEQANACEPDGSVDLRLSPLSQLRATAAQVVDLDAGGHAVTGAFGCVSATMVPAARATLGACELTSGQVGPATSSHGFEASVGGDRLGGLIGAAEGSHGGGLGLSGEGLGGGGTGAGTIGTGTGTVALGRGGRSGSGGGTDEASARPLARRAGAPSIQGDLTASVISGVVERNIGGVVDCYEQALQLDPSAAGRMEIVFTISPDGATPVASVAELGSGLTSTLGSCVAGAFRRLRFPEPSPAGLVRVRFPLRLDPGAWTPIPEVGVAAGAPLATVDGLVVGSVLEAFRVVVPREQVASGRACFAVRFEGLELPEGFVPLCAPSSAGTPAAP